MVKVSSEMPRRVVSLQESPTTPPLLPASGAHRSSMRDSIPQKTRENRYQKIFDDPEVVKGYESVPLLEIESLPRGGISIETQAVGRIQFGIPPETIKDSMIMGIEVPSVYIVPVERFCREIGPALGINMAEFEFPAYFNYFIRQKRCTLVVDSADAERDIRSVFEETLLGPKMFRNHDKPVPNMDEDFDPSFPKNARPNFYKEFFNFRTAEASSNFQELSVSTLLDFVHYCPPARKRGDNGKQLGVPPTIDNAGADAEPVVRFSEADLLGEQKMMQASMTAIGEKEDVKPRRRRSLSESSIDSGSHSTHSISGTVSSSTRRNSLGSSGSAGDSPQKGSRRRSSMPYHPGDQSGLGSPLSTDKPNVVPGGRRGSMMSVNSALTSVSGKSSKAGYNSIYESNNSIPFAYEMAEDNGPDFQENSWMFSQAKWLGEIATVYPSDATEEARASNSTARVEIFKMAGGTEYIIHDINDKNIIVGKARISGTVSVPDELELEGFMSNTGHLDETDRLMDYEEEDILPQPAKKVAPTFHPPSFGVTVLGNSHGFDKNGSTSGYVLWVNGRGIMIDPPPYSSATLEREGIRPQMIMAIIITHCHADHDAGAFQKVMTGSRVAIITTPTIYKSFIRKYSALSGLRKSLLRHSHRHRPAIIGQPLRFQGAVFHFTYTLHTIPCISFKVEWRGKSIVFTGDHMNIPSAISELEGKGVLSKARAADLRSLPLQDCDVLLHEAGAPPIHTPLKVLQALPEHVKARLYVVHTSAIPAESDLKVAPTGTEGTIRLDSAVGDKIRNKLAKITKGLPSKKTPGIESDQNDSVSPSIEADSFQDGKNQNMSLSGDFDPALSKALMNRFDGNHGRSKIAPLVFLRPTDVSDAWFILNLLSAVPFLSSLSYAHTMEILEIAHVEMYSPGEVVIEGARRPEVLCVFWEGTCVAKRSILNNSQKMENSKIVWHAGDWTGPLSLQPDITRSAHEAAGEELTDITALSNEGVKVIVLHMNDMLRILKNGSMLFHKYATIMEGKGAQEMDFYASQRMPMYKQPDSFEDELLEVIECNSVLRSLTAMQKRYLESLVEGSRYFPPLSMMWKVNDPVDCAYLIVGGTATLGKKTAIKAKRGRMGRRGSTGAISINLASIEEDNSRDPVQTFQPLAEVAGDKPLQNVHPNSEYARLEVGLRQRADEMEDAMASISDLDKSLADKNNSVQAHRDKFANKVLARLYARHAYTEHLIFSRGNFLSDTSRMISGDLANTRNKRSSIAGSSTGGDHHCHTSNLLAGAKGCTVMVFPAGTLVQFLNNNPGVLLSLLGTQVVV